MKTYDPETIATGALPPHIEILESPENISFDQGHFCVYAKDPLVDLPPEHFPHAYHSYVDVREITVRLGGKRPHATKVEGRVGETTVYEKSIPNTTRLLGVNLSLAPFGFELAGQSIRRVIHARRAHAEVKKALGLLQASDSSI